MKKSYVQKFKDEEVRNALKTYEGEDSITSSLDMIEQFDKLPDIIPLKSGLKTLDEWCEGFVDGELAVITGKPKMGKSLFVRTLIDGFSRQMITPLVFTYEEQPRQFLGNFDNGGRDILFHLPRKLRSGDIFWLMDRMMEAKMKKNTRVVFIDHAQYLYEMASTSDSLSVGSVCRNLKDIAREENFIVFLIWHAHKARVEGLEDLDQSMLRDSGMTAGELDHLFIMYREVRSDGITQIDESYVHIECTRRSGVWKKVIPVRKDGGKFVETGVDAL